MSEAQEPESGLPATIATATEMIGAKGLRAKLGAALLKFAMGVSRPEHVDAIVRRYSDAKGIATIEDAIAKAAAQKAAATPAIVDRYLARHLGDAFVAQENVEAILVKAADEVKLLADQSDPRTNDEGPEEEISADWRRKFTRYAEDVSEAEMQGVWARILAGEFLNPGAFSYQTLRVVSELSPAVAHIFARHSHRIMAGDAIFTPTDHFSQGEPFDDLSQLLGSGLIINMPGAMIKYIRRDPRATFPFFFALGNHCLVISDPAPVPERITFPISQLSTAGRELARLQVPSDERAILREIADEVKAQFLAGSHAQIGKLSRIGPGQGNIENIELAWDKRTSSGTTS